MSTSTSNAGTAPEQAVSELGRFTGAEVVQLVAGDPGEPGATVESVHPATVIVRRDRVVATDGTFDWTWLVRDLRDVVHGSDEPWTILVVPDIPDFGVRVRTDQAAEFRWLLGSVPGLRARDQRRHRVVPAAPPPPPPPPPVSQPRVVPPPPPPAAPPAAPPVSSPPPAAAIVPPPRSDAYAAQESVDLAAALADVPPLDTVSVPLAPSAPVASPWDASGDVTTEVPVLDLTDGAVSAPPVVPPLPPAAPVPVATGGARVKHTSRERTAALTAAPTALASLHARNISAWFGERKVLDRVTLHMHAGEVTALIGPSGCGKSTFIRILNRMHEMIPTASLAGEVLLDGQDVYDPSRKLTDARREIGMVFQKPNPFPAMSIYDNVIAALTLTGTKAPQSLKDEIVQTCLQKAGLWHEVKDRLRQPGGGLSGGQQQRLCIARALAIRPRVLLMDEPCSALDPTSTRRIEETILELKSEVTIVIVTHNMQQATRVSDQCAFFLAEQGTPGVIVEHGPTPLMFGSPQDPRTFDYVNGRFG